MAQILLCGGSGHVGALLTEAFHHQGHLVRTLAFDQSPALSHLAALGIVHYHMDLTQAKAPLTGSKSFPFLFPLRILKAITPLNARLSEWLGTNSAITQTALHGLSHYQYVSSERAQRDFGFSPRPLQTTVQDAWNWMQERGMFQPEWKLDRHV